MTIRLIDSKRYIDLFTWSMPLRAKMLIRKIDTDFCISCTKSKDGNILEIRLLFSGNMSASELAEIRTILEELRISNEATPEGLTGSYIADASDDVKLWIVVRRIFKRAMNVRDNQGVWLQTLNARAF